MLAFHKIRFILQDLLAAKDPRKNIFDSQGKKYTVPLREKMESMCQEKLKNREIQRKDQKSQ